MSPKSKDLTLVSKTTALSTAVHLTEEHLIKSAIAVEEEVLSIKLKEVRKELEQLHNEADELTTQRENAIRSVGDKIKTKEIENAKNALNKIGIVVKPEQLAFSAVENTEEKCIETMVHLSNYTSYNRVGFEPKTHEYPLVVIKADLKFEKIFKRQKKLQATIDFILEERSDISKKERRAIASLTARHLGGNDTEEGREFLASMEKVKADMLKKISDVE